MIYRTTSSKTVISKVYRDLNLQDEDRWMDMIEWIGEAIDQIQVPYSLKPIVDLGLEVEDYRAPLPCDLVEIRGILYQGAPLRYLSGIYDFNATNSTSQHPERADRNNQVNRSDAPGYILNPGWINTNFRRGHITMSYLAIPTDEEGFPEIPDNTQFREACYRYIVWKLNYPKYLSGTLPQSIYADMEDQWRWYCGQAGAKAMMPNLDQMEGIKRAMTTLVPNLNKYQNSFRNLPAGSKSSFNNF